MTDHFDASRADRIVDVLSRSQVWRVWVALGQPRSVGDVVDATGMAPATAHRRINDLCDVGLAEQVDTEVQSPQAPRPAARYQRLHRSLTMHEGRHGGLRIDAEPRAPVFSTETRE